MYYVLPHIGLEAMYVHWNFEVRDAVGYLTMKNVSPSVWHKFGTETKLQILNKDSKTTVLVELNQMLTRDALEKLVQYIEEVGIELGDRYLKDVQGAYLPQL